MFLFVVLYIRMTTLDVVVFSYLQAILTDDLPSRELAKIVRQFDNLVGLQQTVSETLSLRDQ